MSDATASLRERVSCDHDLKPRQTVIDTNLKRPRFTAPMPTEVISLSQHRKSGPSLTNYEVDFKILILSAVDDEKLDPALKLAIETLESFWIPYEVIVLTKNGRKRNDLALSYTHPDGTAKYSGIITTEFNLSYQNADTQKYESALSYEQWEDLFSYARRYHIRQVSLFSYPQAYIGVEEIPNVDHGAPNSVTLEGSNLAQYTSGIKTDPSVNIKDVWHYPVRILPDQSESTQPISYFSNLGSSVSATLHKTQDDREQMHFFFTQGKNLFLSKFFAPIWVKWLVRNLYTGKRRTYLSVQIDDVFIPTELFDSRTLGGQPPQRELYRSTVRDIEEYLLFQNDFIKRETQDYHFKIEMAFNGKGILDYGGLKLDPLSIFLQREATSFNWVSHTYNHLELDDLSYDEVASEVLENNKAAFTFLEENIYLYSTKGLVTPRISGLFNGEALEAFTDHNYFYVIGDNTVDDLAPQGNKHLPRKTTLELNGFEGVSIVPRFPNDIFYNVSNPWELKTLFNHLYRYRGNDRLDVEEILEKNAHELTTALLTNDYSMHMFHQANMRVFDYEGGQESLLSLWFKRGLTEFRKYSNLPLKSLSFDQVIDAYNERSKYEQCGLRTRFKYSKNRIKEIKLRSDNNCLVPITGIEYLSLVTPEFKKSEIFGPDKTIYVQSNPDYEVSVYVD